MNPQKQAPIVRFGVFEVSFLSGEVRKAGVRVRVQQQPMKLLEILLERPGQLVTREDLRRRVWPNESFGDFDQAVNVAIAKLRNALGDSAEHPRYIETLPKRGYRFIAAVTVLGNGSSSSPKPETNLVTSHEVAASAASSGNSIASARPARRRYAMFVVASLLFLVLATLAWWWSHSRFQSKKQIRSLAVLPLDNLSGDESQNYFADGMTDELITDLAQIGALRVVSRTSVMQYKNSRKPLPQIARVSSTSTLLWKVRCFAQANRCASRRS
jgi:DNA-binding winged helix-turn-helix (wHTH) protein